jgi:hypothetical protein
MPGPCDFSSTSLVTFVTAYAGLRLKWWIEVVWWIRVRAYGAGVGGSFGKGFGKEFAGAGYDGGKGVVLSSRSCFPFFFFPFLSSVTVVTTTTTTTVDARN